MSQRGIVLSACFVCSQAITKIDAGGGAPFRKKERRELQYITFKFRTSLFNSKFQSPFGIFPSNLTIAITSNLHILIGM